MAQEIKLMKDGHLISDNDIANTRLWTKYPPRIFLEKKTGTITINTVQGCPDTYHNLDVPHDYNFVPLVIGRIKQSTSSRFYRMPAANFPIGTGLTCPEDYELRAAFNYRVKNDKVIIDYNAYCQALIMGYDNECIGTTLTFNYELMFYLWELGSPWPV